MKESEVVKGAVDVIIDAIANIRGVGSDGESYFNDEDNNYDVSLEDGTILVPTCYCRKSGERLFITLKVGFEYN